MERDIQLYRKEGRRYVPVGQEWRGWPADGVWYVHDGRHSLIMRVGDIPDPMPLAAMERHREIALKTMSEYYNEAVSKTLVRGKNGTVSVTAPPLYDMIDVFFKAIAKAEAAQRLNMQLVQQLRY
jgi:hypothetical protein